MSTRRRLVLLLLCLMWPAACGGSSSHSSSPATNPASNPLMPVGAASSSSTKTVKSETFTETVDAVGPTTTRRSRRPPEVPRAAPHRPPRSHGETVGVHIKVPVTIRPGGTGLPPVLALPADGDLDLLLTNRTTATQRVVLVAVRPVSVAIRAGRTADLVALGLHNGSYPIMVNGAPRSRVVVGAQGGP